MTLFCRGLDGDMTGSSRGDVPMFDTECSRRGCVLSDLCAAGGPVGHFVQGCVQGLGAPARDEGHGGLSGHCLQKGRAGLFQKQVQRVGRRAPVVSARREAVFWGGMPEGRSMVGGPPRPSSQVLVGLPRCSGGGGRCGALQLSPL